MHSSHPISALICPTFNFCTQLWSHISPPLNDLSLIFNFSVPHFLNFSVVLLFSLSYPTLVILFFLYLIHDCKYDN